MALIKSAVRWPDWVKYPLAALVLFTIPIWIVPAGALLMIGIGIQDLKKELFDE